MARSGCWPFTKSSSVEASNEKLQHSFVGGGQGQMGKILIALLVISLIDLSHGARADMAEATVVYKRAGCRDRFVAESATGYILLEWYGGADPSRGDQIVGEIHSYGMKDIFNITTRTKTTVWVDDFMLSRSRVEEKMRQHCN